MPDVCRTIEAVAEANALDPSFFARLIWKESLFDAGAVSPKGAQGIAQFIPETAQLRGLEDAFNPAEALSASARYLSELSRDYGNIGLAAVAYNGGEGRLARFLDRKDGLPAETRAYVRGDHRPLGRGVARQAARGRRPGAGPRPRLSGRLHRPGRQPQPARVPQHTAGAALGRRRRVEPR